LRNECLNQIYELAKKDPRVVFIGSDLRLGTLQQFKDEFPDRYFMEGICEQNIIGMAAGLAMDGYIPYVNTIATFLTRRCYEQIALDICLHNLPVRLIANGGGLVYSPLGATHTAIEDISLMRHLPNMSVVCPSDAVEMKELMPQTLDYPHPMYIRIGRGFVDPVIPYLEEFKIGELRHAKLFLNPDTLIISTGLTTDIGLRLPLSSVANVLHMPTVKPFHTAYFLAHLTGIKTIITIEEHVINGGLGSAVLECLANNNIQIPVKRFGIPDNFIKQYGTWDELMNICGLTPEKIVAQL
jgi:transketolase